MKKLIVLLAVLANLTTFGREKIAPEKKSGMGQRVLDVCAAPKSSKEFWLNNVRTMIYTGGDMWWDLNGNGNAYYIIPAVQNRANGVSSSFAGSIWLGGLDAGGQLKVAAMTYRQGGIDFWPGPLDVTNATADPAECSRFDNIYTITRAEVDNFKAGGNITPSILNWPGNGDVSKNQALVLAPFVDVNGDQIYEPEVGDYPAYDINNKAEKDNLGFCKTKLFGDYTQFWVFNDNGGIHTETQGVPIGVEVRAQAFAFKTNDEINNMTFYSYEVHNRSSFQLNSTYFTIWNDADLGYYLDDYVGCDVKRGLGYIYNADTYDETAVGTNGYLDFPPALGCDFFKGPLADYDPVTGVGDGVDNDQDGITDEVGETIQMSRFTYYNNNIGAFPPQTVNPDIAIHYYNYMTGKWKDGSNFTFGGNAYGGTSPVKFVYDGDPVVGTGWTEKASGNLPGDRRFLQSAGPFTLKPGAVNEITFGMPWAQSPTKGGNIESLQLLYSADDKAQKLFDNCFKLLDGPEAPNMTIQEMDGALIFYLTNEKGKSNNYKVFNNDYAEEDISIIDVPTSNEPRLKNPDKFYKFEGYIVYQVKNDAVTSTDLNDRTKAIPIFQCDVVNTFSRLVNYEKDNNIGADVPSVKVDGANKGIQSTFRITQDAFSTTENRNLINSRQYYFICVAYAANEYFPYAPDVPPTVSGANSLGQKRPYLEGRKIKRAAGTPHITDAEKGGTLQQSFYGFGPKITRVEGQGNGGNMLTLTRKSEEEILNSPSSFVEKITYENAQGPLNIKVVDPLNVKNSDFTFRFIHNRVGNTAPTVTNNLMTALTTTNSSGDKFTGYGGTLNADNVSWELKDNLTGKLYYPTDIKAFDPSDVNYQTIRVGNEFYFPDLGLSLNITQVADPGETVNRFTNFMLLTDTSRYTGPKAGSFIGASISYENGTSGWLSFVKDVDGESPFNWIHSGSGNTEGLEDAYYRKNNDKKIQAFYDPQKQFGNILGGTWSPYMLCASYYSITPGPTASQGGAPARIYCGPGFSGEAWRQDGGFFQPPYSPQQLKSAPDQGNTDLRKLNSVLVVLTRDKAKWSRCVVLEMQEKAQLSEGRAIYFSPRKHKSVDKNGDTSSVAAPVASENPDDPSFISPYGMGWFPGYAINLETGERLNLAFGEDSYQKINNGNDMIWNPTSNLSYPYSYTMGGKHFVYVFGGNYIDGKLWTKESLPFPWKDVMNGKPYNLGRYDHGRKMIDILQNYFVPSSYSSLMQGGRLAPFSAFEREIMWVSMPVPGVNYNFTKPENMPSDVRIQINVAKPYRYGWSGVGSYSESDINDQDYFNNINLPMAVKSPTQVSTHVSSSPQNNNFPLYTFNTSDIATLFNQGDVVKNALDQIRIVPNPYYGSSVYEQRRTDNFVRITNLPSKCKIRIYTINGTLVRTIDRDVTGQEDIYLGTQAGGDDIKRAKRSSYVQWDLKNQNGISIASGLYIFHVDAPGVGEKILKWFGVMRPLDVQNY